MALQTIADSFINMNKNTGSGAQNGPDISPTQTNPGARADTNGTIISEGGHNWTRIQPMTKHSAESVATWFNGLFTTIIGVATLGAGITFNYIISTNVPPSRSTVISSQDIQLFLAISWLMFILALAFASLGSTLLTFFKDHWKKDWDGKHGKRSQRSVQIYATFATGLLSSLTIAAFIFLCLVIIAYTPVVGWVALGWTSLFGFICACGVFYQAPWPWRDNSPSPASTTKSSRTNTDKPAAV